MERWVCARKAITGTPERLVDALAESVPEVLQTATGAPLTPPHGDGSFDIELKVHFAGADLHKTVRATVGEVRRKQFWTAVPLSWRAEKGRPFLPGFEGSIEMEELSSTSVNVCVVGHYHPPLGPLGALGDATVFADLAQRTVEDLVHGLARALVDRVYGEEPPRIIRTEALLVRDVAATHELLSFHEDTSLRAAASLLLRGRVSGAPVLDDDGRVVGILSARDLLDKAAHAPTGLGHAADEADRRFHASTAGEACSRPARTTEADTPVRDAATEMAARDVDRLVVMDGATVVGMVTRTDILRALIRDDDDIADAIRAEVRAAGHADAVVAEVSYGVVALRGALPTRSTWYQLLEAVRDADGVIDVDFDELRWEYDDLIPRTPIF